MADDGPCYRARRLPLGVLTTVAVVALIAGLAGALMAIGGSPRADGSEVEPAVATAAADRASAPVRIKVGPQDGVRAMDAPVSVMPSACTDVIEPPYDSRVGDVFWCSDYAALGSGGDRPTVLAGHAGASIDTVFNDLYPRGDAFVGQTVRFETAGAGERAYRVTAVYTPAKADLPYLTQVWGTPGQQLGGRVVLVTCLQTPDGAWGKNYVAVLSPA
ncbi:class F sortase [Gordonia phthalatica]|uniref:Sortase n=1 Tax=Gordonia phthalatica TaxID=1136941 RepID=A0A0N9MNE2_9ACTN|nr:class F sortase [Gordonia phthalatica]ALG84300.1 hypothetical protein ACH46_07030 [Gordonia phthalatica]